MAGRHADVVRVLFESQPETAVVLSFEHPQSNQDFLDEAVHLVALIFLDFLKRAEIIADLFGNFDEGAEVFRKALPPKPRDAFRKRRANAGIMPSAIGNLLHIGARRLAKPGDGIDVRKSWREKRIGGCCQFGGS